MEENFHRQWFIFKKELSMFAVLTSKWEETKGAAHEDPSFVTLQVICHVCCYFGKSCCVLSPERRSWNLFIFCAWKKINRAKCGDGRRRWRRAAGGRSCHQRRRIMVGEVKIEATQAASCTSARAEPNPHPGWCQWPANGHEHWFRGGEGFTGETGVVANMLTACLNRGIMGWRGTHTSACQINYWSWC